MRFPPRLFRSLRFRLTAAFVLGLGIVLFAGAVLLHARTAAALEEEADTRLRLAAREPAESLRDGDSKIDVEESDLDTRSLSVTLRVLDQGGRHVVCASRRAAALRWPLPRRLPPGEELATMSPNGRQSELRVLTFAVRGPSGRRYVVQAATPWTSSRLTLARQDLTAGCAIPLLLAAIGIAGWILVGQALRPVDEIAAKATQISEANLDQRLSVPAHDDELGRLAKTLNGMIDRLESAFRGERRFTADVSHELRTPLAALRGRLEVLVSRPRTGEEYRKAIQAALGDVARMAHIVEDLLSLARAEREREPPECEPVSLGRLAGETVGEFEGMAAAKALRLRVAADPNAVLLGDEGRLRRLVGNLVENALKYTPAGGQVRVEVFSESGECVLTVSDTGIGIPAEDLPHVFERFYRSDKSRDRGTGGAGLGLAIADWVVKTHHGRLEVASRPGEGTVFRARLPAVPPGALAECPGAAGTEEAVTQSRRKEKQ